MFTKDRYSKTFLVMSGSALLSAYLYRNGKGNLAAAAFIPFIFSSGYLAYLFTQPAKLHLNKEQKKRLDPEYKGENDCKFSRSEKTEIDGIKVKGKRYKFVNGTDICLNVNDEILPCGFGSSIMQLVGGGGLEPKSIQSDNCWL
jgi:hypothetical protein